MKKSNISFFFEDVKYKINNNKIINLIEALLKCENKKIGSINYIFCSDKFLYDINVKSLQHDTLTDVITFDYSENGIIEGEIYISLDRVKDNAQNFEKSIDDELLRVIVHGALHLSGYKDKIDDDAKIMRSKENFYMAQY